jgi:4-coumarate--CoA ligase
MNVKDNIIHRSDDSKLYENTLSLGHLMIENLTEAGNKTMLVSGITGEKLTALELVHKSIEIAKALQTFGIKQGDVVSIVSENRFEFAFVLFGTIFLNCALAPINNSYSEREMKHALNLSKPKIIFASAAVSQQIINVTNSLSFVQKVILLDNESKNEKKTMNLKEFLDAKVLRNLNFEPKAVNQSETVCCLIMCSSGTTGLPKGVQISQKNIIVTTRHVSTIYSAKKVGEGEVVVLGEELKKNIFCLGWGSTILNFRHF